jgi:hypothetical protein
MIEATGLPAPDVVLHAGMGAVASALIAVWKWGRRRDAV